MYVHQKEKLDIALAEKFRDVNKVRAIIESYNENFNIRKTADKVGVSTDNVCYYLRRCGITKHTKRVKLITPPLSDNNSSNSRLLREKEHLTQLSQNSVKELYSNEKITSEFKEYDLLYSNLYNKLKETIPLAKLEEIAKDLDISKEVISKKDRIESIVIYLLNNGNLENKKEIKKEFEKCTEQRNKISFRHMGLLKKYAGYFARCNPDETFENLYMEGYLGLLKAINGFDIKKGFRFSTYSTWWIKETILRHLQNSGKIRVPVYIQESVNLLNKVQEKFFEKHGRAPTYQEISSITRWNLDKIKKICEIIKPKVVSLDEELNDEYTKNLMEIVTDNEQKGPDEIIEKESIKETIEKALLNLTPKEENILRARHGITHDTENKHYNNKRALEEVGEDYGLSRQRIEQIEKIALNKLKHDPEILKLRS
ncbi:MAG: sigma-70 family RNA polymerase sigma factor [Candidatus Nanoarchaeia archaeon]